VVRRLVPGRGGQGARRFRRTGLPRAGRPFLLLTRGGRGIAFWLLSWQRLAGAAAGVLLAGRRDRPPGARRAGGFGRRGGWRRILAILSVLVLLLVVAADGTYLYRP
jgi:hypothetical protein